MPRQTTKWNVVIELTATIKSMYDTLPLVQDLRDEAMRERHWKKLMAIVRCPPRFDPTCAPRDSNSLCDSWLPKMASSGGRPERAARLGFCRPIRV